jgi:hypothetical protein
MKLTTKLCVILLSGIIVTSCSSNQGFFNDDSKDYLSSINDKKLVVPSPLTDAYITNYYTLPSQNKMAEVSSIPPGSRMIIAKTWLPSAGAKVMPRAIHPAADMTGFVIERSIGQTWSIIGSGLARKSFDVIKVDEKNDTYLFKKGGWLRAKNAIVYKVKLRAQGADKTFVSLTDVNNNRLPKRIYISVYKKLRSGIT